MSDLQRLQLIALLGIGRDHAQSARALALALDISERQVGQLVAEAIEQEGYLVGSTCSGVDGTRPGYFLIADLADLEAGTAHIVARAKRSFVRVAALRRAARERFSEAEVLHLFSLEDVG